MEAVSGACSEWKSARRVEAVGPVRPAFRDWMHFSPVKIALRNCFVYVRAMTFFSALSRSILCAAWIGLLAGCTPERTSQHDDEKDPHYLTGRSRAQNLDYRGAVEAYQKALESNPDSAPAHFELGLLYADKLNETDTPPDARDMHHAAAIYHFVRFLQCDPKSPRTNVVQKRILECKVDLAKAVQYNFVNDAIRRDMQMLTKTNMELRERVERLTQQLAEQAFTHSNQVATLQTQHAADLNAARANASQPQADLGRRPDSNLADRSQPPASSRPQRREREQARNNPPSGTISNPGRTNRQDTTSGRGARAEAAARNQPQKSTPAPSKSTAKPQASVRYHRVQPGETLQAVARRYNIPASALLSANPGLSDGPLRTGQDIRLPAPKG
jgi:LysM repeat protein